MVEDALVTDNDQPKEDPWRVQDIIDSLYGFVGIYTLDGKLIEANEAPIKAAGIKPEDVIGKPFWDTYWWSYSEKVQSNLKDAMMRAAAGELVRYDAPVRMAEGVIVTVDVTFGPLKDKSGEQTHIIGFAVDVSEKVKAVADAMRQEAFLAEAQRLANVGSWELDLKKGELNWSAQVFCIFEIDPEKFDASYDAFLNAVHPEDRTMVDEAYQNSLETKAPYEIEHRLLMADGRIKYVVENCETHYADDGTPLRSIGTVQDITERRLMEEELRASKKEAERANLAKSEFLSRMSHELRTPLNAIIGFAQVLQFDQEDDPSKSQQGHISEIVRAGAHLLDLVDEVLELSRIESGQVESQCENVAIASVVNDALSFVRTMAERNNITIDALKAVSCRYNIWADRIRVKQALLNLISNAVKYNRPGGIVRIDTKPLEDGFLRIIVEDSGPGIPEERHAELFEPFNRLGSETSDIEGTGIGLTITKRLVEAMGGTLGFESEVGKGSKFWIDLPLTDADEISADADEHSAATRLSDGKHRVLYVEDNPTNVRLMEAIFKKLPNLVLMSAHTGELGVEVAKSYRPDLILMDITLPGINGISALKQLQNDEATKDIPAVAISANALPHDIEVARAAGFEEYFTKPLQIPKFLKMLDRYTGKSDAA